ncbi:unnamed protein product, partial [Dracunculus medinensis]|uniref:Ubiq_cyt_C_chap domain-containing protein n=1 Tax=Dracunculus medinensis TaxID=318479 RepID=A0A0N4U6F3_DRAME
LDKASAQLCYDCCNRYSFSQLCDGLLRIEFHISNAFFLQYYFSAFGLPDHFTSWFKLTLMHIWMALLRLHVSLEAKAYLRVRHGVLSAFWLDVDNRIPIIIVGFNLRRFPKKSGEEVQSGVIKAEIKKMHGLHLQTLFEYDEGFLSSDAALAGAIWRCLYVEKNCDPIHVNKAVQYIRSTVILCFHCLIIIFWCS